MDDDDNNNNNPKTVIVITLPPQDNPSLGKTITAYTLNNSPPSPRHHPHQTHQNPVHHSPQDPTFSLPRTLSLSGRRLVFRFIAVSVVALTICFFGSSKTVTELRNLNEDKVKKESFLFPLYPKSGFEREIQLKLGRFKEGKLDNELVSNLEKVDTKSVIFPVRGNVYPDGLYYTHVLFGSPPKPYFLDVDTGSDLTWIQCDAPCTSCAKGAHPLYKPTKLKIIPPKDSLCVEVQRNYKNGFCEKCKQCDYEIEYADQSSSMGVLAKDELHLSISNGSLTKPSVVFGCAYDQQGLLLNSLTKTDGILGLSKSKVSLPSQLASQGIIKNVVGHCISTEAQNGGYMLFGEDFVPYWKLAWITMLNNPSTFYEAEVTRISYGRSQLSLGNQYGEVERVVFDSGSSYTYFTREAYSKLIASLQDISDADLLQDTSDPTLPICWRAKTTIRSLSEIEQLFKPITLQFGGKWWINSRKLLIMPEDYLIINNKGNVCLGILDGSNIHDGSTFILGDISLRGRLVVYDNVNQKIGWTKSDCVNPQKFDSVPLFGDFDLGIYQS